MSTVVTRIKSGLEMMVTGIILLIMLIVRNIAAFIAVVVLFVAGVATIFGIDKIADLCEKIIGKINKWMNNKWD